jgi:hypothetical protein
MFIFNFFIHKKLYKINLWFNFASNVICNPICKTEIDEKELVCK